MPAGFDHYDTIRQVDFAQVQRFQHGPLFA